MKFGVNTFLWTGDFSSKDFAILPQIREHGFDGAEISLFRPAEFDAASVRRALSENQLEATVCSVLTPGLSLISDDAAVRSKTRTHLAACVKATAEAGAKLIAGPLYSPVGYLPGRRRTADEWKWAVDGYQEVGPTLKDYGVEVGIEPLNRFETFFLNTTADAIRLCEEIGHPNVGILWDTFHANIEEKSLGEALRSAGKYVKHIHTCENDRGIPGSGHVGWPEVFDAIRTLGYDRWLTIESFGFAIGDLAAAASIWRDLASTPDEIAWNGIKFLKEGIAGQAAHHS